MPKMISLMLSIALSLCSSLAFAQHENHTATTSPDTTRKSIQKETHAYIGSNHLTMHYHAPAVRNRVIWGGLVPFDQVWVTGAHNATSVEWSQPIRINGKVIPAGKYALFTIPGKKTWTVIINSNWEQHLCDEYSEADDLIRITVKPTKLKQTVERLNYAISAKSPQVGAITMQWEKLSVSIPVQNVP
jgi:hypothetical protein